MKTLAGELVEKGSRLEALAVFFQELATALRTLGGLVHLPLASTRRISVQSTLVLSGSLRTIPGRSLMNNLISRVLTVSAVIASNVSLALANEPKGEAPDYSGISFMYYTLIALVLGYGVYDTFFKKS